MKELYCNIGLFFSILTFVGLMWVIFIPKFRNEINEWDLFKDLNKLVIDIDGINTPNLFQILIVGCTYAIVALMYISSSIILSICMLVCWPIPIISYIIGKLILKIKKSQSTI